MNQVKEEQMKQHEHASTTIRMDVTPENWPEVARDAVWFGEFMTLAAKLAPSSITAETKRLYMEFHASWLFKKYGPSDEEDEIAPIRWSPAIHVVTKAVRKEVTELVAEAQRLTLS